MKIVTILGARPQFIKAAAFSNKFRKNKKNIEIIIHTGQHYDKNMSSIFFNELDIPLPNYNLNIGSASHGKQTGEMMIKIEKILLNETPDFVLVYGDTNSTLAGALAASKLHIPVLHIEAGLRSYNKAMPEELNRLITDHLSDLLFCPTQTSVKNLKKENIFKGVHLVGDVMLDAVLNYSALAEKKYENGLWRNEITSSTDIPSEKKYYLATIHRPINTDNINNLTQIFSALNQLDKKVIMPLHPRTKNKIKDLNLNIDNIIVIEPVGYLLMLYLTKNAYMVITDSGGLQKEAYFLNTPVTTLRNETEWVETLENQRNVLCEINVDSIIKSVKRQIKTTHHQNSYPFGKGDAAEKIINIIENYRNFIK